MSIRKKNPVKLGTLIITAVLSACMALACFPDAESANSGGKRCEWEGSDGTAPEGAHDCRGNTIVRCIDGKWEEAVSCSSVWNSSGYRCTCKDRTNTVECSYAFDVCGGMEYPTCGDFGGMMLVGDHYECP